MKLKIIFKAFFILIIITVINSCKQKTETKATTGALESKTLEESDAETADSRVSTDAVVQSQSTHTESSDSKNLPGAVETVEKVEEIGGRDGPDPTRYGDWEKNGRCIDF